MKYLLILSYIFVFLLSLIELLTYRGVILKYVSFEYITFVLIALFLVLLFRVFVKDVSSLGWLIKLNNSVFLPITLILSILTFALEAYNFPNYVFSTLGINHYILIPLLLYIYFFKVITLPIEKYRTSLYHIFFFGFLLVSFLVYTSDPIHFSRLSYSGGGHGDDNFMEWMQVLILFMGMIVSFVISLRSKKILLKLVFIGASLLFLVLIGEEISWGQRYLNTTSSVDDSGYQFETNLHNQVGFNEFTALLYYVAFLYAVISWYVRYYFQKKGVIGKNNSLWYSIFCFRGVEILYLLPTFIINPYMDRHLYGSIPSVLDIYYSWHIIPDYFKFLTFVSNWREAFEVLFYASFTIHVLQLYKLTLQKHIK